MDEEATECVKGGVRLFWMLWMTHDGTDVREISGDTGDT